MRASGFSVGNDGAPENNARISFFSADDPTHGRELWDSDGSSAGTTLVNDINPGRANSYPDAFINFAGRVFFRAREPTHGFELWKAVP